MIKKILSTLGTLVLAAGMAVGFASPAGATHPTVVGTYECDSGSGSFTVTWTVGGDTRYPNEIATIVSQSVETSPTLVGSSVQAAGFVQGTQSGVAVGATVNQTVKVQWTNHAAGNLVSQTGTVEIPADAACAVADASASVTVTPATCDAPSTLVYDTPVNATFTGGTPDGTQGPTTGTAALPYSVTATANPNHSFSDGRLTTIIKGDLAPQVTGADCYVPPACIPTSAVSYTYDPATNSGVITVADVEDSSHVLCDPFWVTATSWKFVGNSKWPQIRDVVQKLDPISTPGTYEYAAEVNCGQGDIYASFDAQPDPTPVLNGPSNPFKETFLHGMGFSGPNPTYIQDNPGCAAVKPLVDYELGACYQAGQSPEFTSVKNLTLVFDNSASTVPVTFSVPDALDIESAETPLPSITRTVPPGEVVEVETEPVWDQGANYTVSFGGVHSVTIPDSTLIIDAYDGCLEATPSEPSQTDESCIDDILQPGSITVGLETGLVYSIDGPGTENDVSPVTETTTEGLPAGEYLVGVMAAPGYVLTGATDWPRTVTIASTVCGDLPTEPLVSPVASMTEMTCTAPGSYTLQSSPGVLWTVDGTPVSGGTYSVTTASTVVVSATPNAPLYGFEFGFDIPTVWEFEYGDPETSDCNLQLTTLALTGVSSSFLLMLAGGALFVGIGGIIMARRRYSTH